MAASSLIVHDLAADQRLIGEALAAILSGPLAPALGKVPEAMRYAVMGGGQRLRPILSLRVARLLEGDAGRTLDAACAVEMFHCASLVVDDLPSMDDEKMRRSRPTVHRAFGEATAILAAFGLVALAARSLVSRHRGEPSRALLEFQSELLGTLGPGGLLDGQVLDLQLSGDRRNLCRHELAALKTVPLFRLAVRAGTLDADGGDAALRLECFGKEFGSCFQMMDDLADGEIEDPAPFLQRIAACRRLLAPFGEQGWELEDLVKHVELRAAQADSCRR